MTAKRKTPIVFGPLDHKSTTTEFRIAAKLANIGAKKKTTELPADNAARQRLFRAKRAQDGLIEVRGIFAPAEVHDVIKAYAVRAMKKRAQGRKGVK